MPGRVPDPAEIAEDLVDIRRELTMLRDAVNKDFVRADLHNEQIGSIRRDLAGIQTSQSEGFSGLNAKFMWVLGVLGAIFVAVIVAAATTMLRGGA